MHFSSIEFYHKFLHQVFAAGICSRVLPAGFRISFCSRYLQQGFMVNITAFNDSHKAYKECAQKYGMTNLDARIGTVYISAYKQVQGIYLNELKTIDAENEPDKAGRIMENYGVLQRAIRKQQKKAGLK